MGLIGAPSAWIRNWDGLSPNCWRSDTVTGLEQDEICSRIKRLVSTPAIRGYVIKGASGAGKRELVRESLQMSEYAAQATWVSGSRYGREVPYGAIHFLLTDLAVEHIDSPLAVFGVLKSHFAKSVAKPLIVLEQPGLIDGLSIAVLAQLASNGVIQLIVIDDQAHDVPLDIATLIRTDEVLILQLQPLSLSEARSCIELLVGHRISHVAAAILREYTAGSLETLRAVVLDCLEVGQFKMHGDSAALLNGRFLTGSHLEKVVARRIEQLTVEQREILEAVSLTGDLPFVGDRQGQQTCLDELHARGLMTKISPQSAQWRLSNPGLSQALNRMRGELNQDQWELTYGDSELLAETDHSLWTSEQVPLEEQPFNGNSAQWIQIRDEALACWNSGNIDQAIILLQDFRNGTRQVSAFHQVQDNCESMLVLLELLLGAGQLETVEALIMEFDPTPNGQTWAQFSSCQQHLALALTAEYLTRLNHHESASIFIDALLLNLSLELEEQKNHRIHQCMAGTIRSLISSCLGLGKWEHCQKLIGLVLEGNMPDRQLITFAETARSILLFIAGNAAEAKSAVEPLLLQLESSGTVLERSLVEALMGALDPTENRALRGPATDPAVKVGDRVPQTVLECVWRIFEAFGNRVLGQADQTGQELQRLTDWALNSGEILLASHLLALQIRDGHFEVAGTLALLQSGQTHELARAFLDLSEGAKTRDGGKLSIAVGELAAVGFSAFAAQEGNKIFEYLSPEQRRQASRRTNNILALMHQKSANEEFHVDLRHNTELTSREKFVASAAASGLSNLEIAEQASVSVRTVEGHLYQVYSKLGIRRRGELLEFAGDQKSDVLDQAR